jgi:hypothetical protein
MTTVLDFLRSAATKNHGKAGEAQGGNSAITKAKRRGSVPEGESAVWGKPIHMSWSGKQLQRTLSQQLHLAITICTKTSRRRFI